MSWPKSSGEFHLGDFQVQSGEVIRDARLVWKTHGTLAPERDKSCCILAATAPSMRTWSG